MNILISGAGIAGPTLAYWLAEYGYRPTLVEHAPSLRTGGYIIDFWGLGFDVAERMGLLPELKRTGYHVKEVRMLNSRGKRVGGFSAEVFVRLTQDRYLSIPRGDLAAAIYERINRRVETIFGDEITAIEQTAATTRVSFKQAGPREFDLVIGADGLHSKVRSLVFGPQTLFEKYLGYKVAGFEVPGYRPRDEDIYMMFTEIGQQIGRFTMRGDRTMFLFVFADDDPQVEHELSAQKAVLKQRFGDSGWETPAILKALDSTEVLYYDRVSQIRMNSWAKDRVALVGDAAFCVSLLAGQGTALAMAAAYILAGELKHARGDHQEGFARYRQLFGSFVAKKQFAAERFAGTFAPKSAFGLFFRNQISKVLDIPLIADIAIGNDLRDKLALPEY